MQEMWFLWMFQRIWGVLMMNYGQNTQIWLKILTFYPPGDHRGVTLGSKKIRKNQKYPF